MLLSTEEPAKRLEVVGAGERAGLDEGEQERLVPLLRGGLVLEPMHRRGRRAGGPALHPTGRFGGQLPRPGDDPRVAALEVRRSRSLRRFCFCIALPALQRADLAKGPSPCICHASVLCILKAKKLL